MENNALAKGLMAVVNSPFARWLYRMSIIGHPGLRYLPQCSRSVLMTRRGWVAGNRTVFHDIE
jgi:hypothetical protein